MDDFSQQIAEISVYRDRLRLSDPNFDERFRKWAIAVILQSNPKSNIHAALSTRPIERHWCLLMSLLPDGAVISLYRKLLALYQEAA